MEFGDVRSHQSPGCLAAGVHGSNNGWGCSTCGGSLLELDMGMLLKCPNET